MISNNKFWIQIKNIQLYTIQMKLNIMNKLCHNENANVS